MVESLGRIALTVALIFLMTEIAKRSSFIAAIIASSPIATIATCLWLYSENEPIEKIRLFAWQTTLLLPPSLVFFIGFPIALKKGMPFHFALPLFASIMLFVYAAYCFTLQRFGIRFE